MKKFLLAVLTCFSLATAWADNGYNIKVTLKPFARKWVYLGYYYGKMKAVADSVLLDENHSGVFKGKEKLPGGIYFVVSPKKEILFELLIDKEQQFSMEADSSTIPKVNFSGSVDNLRFQQYTDYMNQKGKLVTAEQARLSAAKNHKDSTAVMDKLKLLNKEIQDYRSDIVSKYPESLLATLLLALREPQVPKQPEGNHDSLFAYHYYKAHYWDGLSFTDDRLIRTPIFEPRLEKYYKELVVPEPDSISREADMMLLFSRSNKEMFKYLLIFFVQKYINPEFMGQDAVFVHLFEKYINTGQADFFTEKYRKFVNDRAYSLMANLIGQPAGNLTLTDTLEKTWQLYGAEAPYTIVCFWDPTCSHCKETVPKVDSIFQAKWKKEGIQLVGVMVDGGKDNWLKFIREHNLNGWVHVYQTPAQKEAETASGNPGYKQLYDVYQTPIIYLLDKDKRIIAKKLNYQQFDQVLDLKLRNVKSN